MRTVFNLYLFNILFLSAYMSTLYAQNADAGPDKFQFKDCSVKIGPENPNSSWCYTWESSPVDATLESQKHDPNPSVKPTVTTTYTLTVVGNDFEFKETDQMTLTILTDAALKLEVEDNITECMENRLVTFTAKLTPDYSTMLQEPLKYTFYFERADGTKWDATEESMLFEQDHTAVSDQVLDGDVDHMIWQNPTYVEVSHEGCMLASNMVLIDVYELWIDYFRNEAPSKDWKIVVGQNMIGSAIASTDCENWDWDMEDGFFDTWNPIGGDQKTSTMVIPDEDLPTDNDWNYFGETYGTVNVSCEDGEGNNHQIYSTDLSPSQKAKVFFRKDDATNPGHTDPNWFYYWKMFIPRGSIQTLVYGGVSTLYYALTDPGTKTTTIYNLSSEYNHITGHRGLHTFYEKMAHENHHLVIFYGWWPNWPAGWDISLDSDRDLVPDSWELTVGSGWGFIVGNDDSYQTGGTSVNNTYQETQCENVERALNSSEFDANDWSFDWTSTNQGKQW